MPSNRPPAVWVEVDRNAWAVLQEMFPERTWAFSKRSTIDDKEILMIELDKEFYQRAMSIKQPWQSFSEKLVEDYRTGEMTRNGTRYPDIGDLSELGQSKRSEDEDSEPPEG